MNDWFENASDKLQAELSEEKIKHVKGYDFIFSYLKDNQPDEYTDIDFNNDDDKIDEIVRSVIDIFEEWLRNQNNDWIYIGSGYLWLDNKSRGKKEPKVALIEAPNLTDDENAFLEKSLDLLSSDDYDNLNNLYQKLLNTEDVNLIAECSYRIAWSQNNSNTTTYSDKADFWERAGKKAIDAGRPGCYKFYSNAAEIHGGRMRHQKSAKLYKVAIEQAKIDSMDSVKLLDLARSCRKQFEMSGETSEAAKIFILENEIKLKEATGRKKLFLWFYKYLSNYGEAPLRVAFWSLFIIFVCAIGFCLNGISSSLPRENVYSFGTSIYFSFVTFTTLGYGDFSPINTTGRVISAFEAVSGLFLTSLFLVTFVRKYSR